MMDYQVLCLFIAKHTLADYFFQSKWMLKKGNTIDWAVPLAAHCLVHALLTLAIVLIYTPNLWWLAILDGGFHFLIDRAKGVFSRSSSPMENSFWRAFGTDQALHLYTYVLILYLMTH